MFEPSFSENQSKRVFNTFVLLQILRGYILLTYRYFTVAFIRIYVNLLYSIISVHVRTSLRNITRKILAVKSWTRLEVSFK